MFIILIANMWVFRVVNLLCVLFAIVGVVTPDFSSTTHAYDDAYNATTLRGTSSIAYNSDNQRTTGSFAYDGNGNATTFKGDSAYYDYANRLTVYEPAHAGNDPYFNVGYAYCGDGLMGKRAKHVYVYAGGHWTEAAGNPTYIYNLDGHPAVEYTESIEEEGDPTVNQNVFAPDGLMARKQGGAWIYYQFDQQGNVAQRLNSGGTVLNSSSYDAYGAETTSGTSQGDCFGYNAQWGYVKDVDTGLYYCQNRWYDPATGRWLSRDPIGFAGGANLYGYCGGGPVGWQDVFGLQQRRVIAGDTSGWAAFGWFAHPGSENAPGRKAVIDALSNSDEVVLWGHGNTGNAIYDPNGNYLTEEDINEVARNRRKNKKGKLKKLEIDECFVMADQFYVNKLLEITDEVWGFEGWTVHPGTGRPGVKRKYSSPFSNPTKPRDNDGNYKKNKAKPRPSTKDAKQGAG